MRWSVGAGVCAAIGCGVVQGGTITLQCDKDATLYETATGNLANGSGEYLFAGKTNTAGLRRALLHFNLGTSIPAGATINSATLTLHLSKTASDFQPAPLHRMLNQWSEGPSNPNGNEGQGTVSLTGDVTWIHRTYSSVLWATPGGEFVSNPSAIGSVGFENIAYSWSSPGMAADVAAWLANPSTNFGWVLMGNETFDGGAKRFDSRSGPSANRPTLTIVYTPAPVGDVTGDGIVNIDDLTAVILNWGNCPVSQPCGADLTHDGVVNIDDLSAVILSWSA
ncbi:MAG TPA: DNRLRE domain-containing protein [Phycisphaerales bacterium]|nr:DNRLRE domain-containing protein [Phycisphaerales bacterium]